LASRMPYCSIAGRLVVVEPRLVRHERHRRRVHMLHRRLPTTDGAWWMGEEGGESLECIIVWNIYIPQTEPTEVACIAQA